MCVYRLRLRKMQNKVESGEGFSFDGPQRIMWPPSIVSTFEKFATSIVLRSKIDDKDDSDLGPAQVFGKLTEFMLRIWLRRDTRTEFNRKFHEILSPKLAYLQYGGAQFSLALQVYLVHLHTVTAVACVVASTCMSHHVSAVIQCLVHNRRCGRTPECEHRNTLKIQFTKLICRLSDRSISLPDTTETTFYGVSVPININNSCWPIQANYDFSSSFSSLSPSLSSRLSARTENKNRTCFAHMSVWPRTESTFIIIKISTNTHTIAPKRRITPMKMGAGGGCVGATLANATTANKCGHKMFNNWNINIWRNNTNNLVPPLPFTAFTETPPLFQEANAASPSHHWNALVWEAKQTHNNNNHKREILRLNGACVCARVSNLFTISHNNKLAKKRRNGKVFFFSPSPAPFASRFYHPE